MHRTQVQPARDDAFELFGIECDAAADSAERKRRTDDYRKPKTSNNALSLTNISYDFASRRLEADLRHRLFEELAVLRHMDGLGFGADHLDVVFVEDAALS